MIQRIILTCWVKLSEGLIRVRDFPVRRNRRHAQRGLRETQTRIKRLDADGLVRHKSQTDINDRGRDRDMLRRKLNDTAECSST